MTVVSDFTTILADTQEETVSGKDLTVPGWDTGGRHEPGTAYISLMVKDLTSGAPSVFVNDKSAGKLVANDGHWQTQTVTLKGELLNDGTNTLRISDVPGKDFKVRCVICHFKQDV